MGPAVNSAICSRLLRFAPLNDLYSRQGSRGLLPKADCAEQEHDKSVLVTCFKRPPMITSLTWYTSSTPRQPASAFQKSDRLGFEEIIPHEWCNDTDIGVHQPFVLCLPSRRQKSKQAQALSSPSTWLFISGTLQASLWSVDPSSALARSTQCCVFNYNDAGVSRSKSAWL